MPAFPDIRAITFDIDDTLWDLTAALDAALVEAHAALRASVAHDICGHVDIEYLARVREEVATELAHERHTNRTWLEDVRRESFHRLTVELAIDDRHDVAERMCEAFFRRRFDHVTLYEDVHPTLDLLREHVALGVITNGNTSLAATAVHEHFSTFVAAGEHGWTKPDRRIFDRALADLACAAEQVVHVGDSLAEDVAGAQALGMRAVWFNPGGRANETDVRPDAEIRAMSELVPLVVRSV